jgi:WD40 repeat protein
LGCSWILDVDSNEAEKSAPSSSSETQSEKVASETDQTVSTPTLPAAEIDTASPTETPVDSYISKEMIFSEAGGDILGPELIGQDCLGKDLPIDTDLKSGEGIVVFDRSDHMLKVFGKDGLVDPLYTIDAPGVSKVGWEYSHHQNWFSYLDGEDHQTRRYSVTNLQTEENIQKDFEIHPGNREAAWADPTHFVIPLKRSGNLFRWIVWHPFTQGENSVSVEIPEFGDSDDGAGAVRPRVYPFFDPVTNRITYVCYTCEKMSITYRVLQADTREILWSAIYPQNLLAPLDFAWSPDGKFIAIPLDDNQIWVLSDQGESVLKINTPDRLTPKLRWSPDGKSLAFNSFRANGSPRYFMNIVSLDKKEINRYCQGIGDGVFRWSYDSLSVVQINNHGSVDAPQDDQIIILEVKTGQVHRFATPNSLLLVDWMKS